VRPVGLGLDIGATKTLAVAVDREGTVLGERRVATRRGAAAVVDTAAGAVEALLASLPADAAVRWPVGVGVPGLVDVQHGTVKHAVNLGLDGSWLPLRDRLEERLGRPVLVENDVNAAAVGASALLAAEQAAPTRDLAYLSLGTGLAAGLVLDGRPRRGVHGAAGEVGHIPVDPAGRWCPCGQRGCLETVASGSALAAAWPTPPGTPPATALFAAAASGSAAARAVRDDFAAGVAAAVRLLCLIVDVDAVVLGGGVAEVGEPLRIAVAQALRAQVEASPFLGSLHLAERLRVVPPGHPVAAVGAALMGRPDLSDDLSPAGR
jgi:glucokinase